VSSPPSGLPSRAALGGWQYPAQEGGERPNSYLAYLAYADAPNYGLERLSRRHRRYVRLAQRRFLVRPLDRAECKARAHPIYLEFHDRTGYDYLDCRVRTERFERWVDAEYGGQGLIALGAWAGNSLVAVSLSRRVGEAWVYCSFFAFDAAVNGHVADLMLHHIRGLAAAVDGVTMVYAGGLKPRADASVDEFHLRRGATLVRRPAVLRVNPLARWMLGGFRPDLWRRVHGGFVA
jgi:hypothetical protein